jgi:hypothetical protein
MANPTLRSMAVDKILTQFSVAYRNEQYISESIMPVIKVKERSGKFAKYAKDNLRVEDNAERAPGTRARTFDYNVSQGTYTVTEKAMEKIVPDEFVNNADDPYDPKRDATMFCVDKIWLLQETALADTMADTSVITQNTTLAGISQWSDFANSDPFTDIDTARTTIKQTTAKHPNTAVFGYETWQKFVQHPDVVDRVKYVGMTGMDALKRAVADLLQVQNVWIGDAVKNTANDAATDSLSFVWGKHFWLLYVAPRPSLMMPTFGYTMKDLDRVVETYREESRVGDVVRVRDSYDQTIVDVELAYLIEDAVA